MSGRRRHERFAAAQPWEGCLRILRDVTIDDDDDDRGIVVIGPGPGVPGEVAAIDLAGAGTVVTLVICVTESRPVMVHGAVRHAMRAVVLDESRTVEPAGGTGSHAAPATRREVLSARDLVTVLVREYDVHVVNLSGSGCLMETVSPVEVGTTATLRLRAGGEELSDTVRVTRCDRLEGAGARYLVGIEFLWTSAPAPGSLRRAARRLERQAGRGARAVMDAPPFVM